MKEGITPGWFLPEASNRDRGEGVNQRFKGTGSHPLPIGWSSNCTRKKTSPGSVRIADISSPFLVMLLPSLRKLPK